MPVKVPQYRDTQSMRGRNQQNRSVAVSADAFGADIAQGIGKMAQGVDSFAGALDARDALRAEADARNAVNEYRGVIRSGMYDPETGYLVQTGENALGESRGQTFETLAQARDNINNNLSPRAQRAFAQAADGLDNSAQDTAIRHEGVQFRDFTMQSFEASAQGFLDDAVLNAADDNKFNQNLGAAELELRRAAALSGTAPEAIEQQVEDLNSTAHAARVVEFARANPIRAYEYLEANRETINPEEYNRLHEGLQPAYYQAQARDWVAGNNASIGGGMTTDSTGASVNQYGVPSFIVGPESGGNSNAANPESTAVGQVQFLESTYLAYVDKLKPAWAEGLTDAQILQTRRDPVKEGEVYRAFRADNQASLQRNGFAITPRNEYLMHHMGPTVTHLLLRAEEMGTTGGSLRGAIAAAGENPDEWISANPWMQGMTVGGAIRWFEGKVNAHGSGAGATAGTTSGLTNPTQLLQQALEIEDPQLRAATIKELELRINVAEQVRASEARAASDEAWSVIDEGGAPSDIPPDLQVTVGAAAMNEIFNAYERNQIGVDFTAEERHLELLDLARDDPKAFASLDLNDDRANLSRADLLSMKSMQDEINQTAQTIEQRGRSAVVYGDTDYRQAMTDAQDQFTAATGIVPNSSASQEDLQQYNRFTQQLRAEMNRVAEETGRAMTFEERTNFTNALLAPAIIDGVDLHSGWGNGTYLFDVSLMSQDGNFELSMDRANVPPVEANRIEERLTEAFGRKPSADEVTEQYENELLLSIGVPPVVEYRDVPRDVRRTISDNFPDASHEEIAEIFRELSLRVALDEGLDAQNPGFYQP